MNVTMGAGLRFAMLGLSFVVLLSCGKSIVRKENLVQEPKQKPKVVDDTSVVSGIKWALKPEDPGEVLKTVDSAGFRKIYLTQSIARAKSVKDFFTAVKIEINPKVIFFGENHNVGAGSLGYEALLLDLRESGFYVDCVFLEIEVQQQQLLSEVQSGKATLQQFLKRFPSARKKHILDHLEKFMKSRGAPKMYAVDMNAEDVIRGASLKLLSSGFSFVSRRNHFMHSKISKIIHQDGCKDSVYIGGFGHLGGAALGESSLSKLFQKDGQTTFSVLVSAVSDIELRPGVMTSIAGLHPWIWPKSEWNPKLKLNALPSAFSTPIGQSPRLIPADMVEVGTLYWNDFQAAILVE